MTTNRMDEQKEAVTPVQTQDGTCPARALREAPTQDSVVLDREDPEFLANAPAIYAELRALGPVVRCPFGRGISDGVNPEGSRARESGRVPGRDRLFVSRYDDAVSVLLSDRYASDMRSVMTPEQRARLEATMPEEFRPLAHSILMLDPPDHTRLRKLVQPNFTARAMELLRPRIQRLVNELLDTIERKAAERGEAVSERRMDLIESFAYPLPVTVISDMLGIPAEDREQVHGWAELLLRADRKDAMRDDRIRASLRAFSQYLDGLFERKRRAPAEDMISQMLHVQEDGDTLSHREMVSMVFILFFAGHVTTVNLIGNGVFALLTHPEQHARFLADPTGLAKGLVEETLRYWGPVDYISTPRIALEEMELGGTRIPKGENLSVGLSSANRDPARFANPEVFDITRPDAHRNIAFGKGIHVCIGAPLARLEGQIAFESLFQRFPKLRLAVPAEEMQWGSVANLRGFTRIPVLF
ncbi:cytochrome P450 family protein [Archangium lansingense]|uniref:Cytochrome P450 n=1 Tax=Archangium lansingense TaxID=2995310 RepID=A0ABT4A8X5_9BACT|nr:cytochrome P450 [Archangium lansinium]MCY1078070.1 cytochrome P450 [Archangium lansinium]